MKTSSIHGSVATAEVETEGNKVSTSFHLPQKTTAIRCWEAAVGAARLDDKVLAADARVSRGHYSKIASGSQGDLLGLIYRIGAKRPSLLKDFIVRLAEAEAVDPRAAAAEQLALAALRYLHVNGIALPLRMAKADVVEIAKAVNQ